MGTGEQRLTFEGNRGSKTILGNTETSQFSSGEQGNRYPLGGPQRDYIQSYPYFLVLFLDNSMSMPKTTKYNVPNSAKNSCVIKILRHKANTLYVKFVSGYIRVRRSFLMYYFS